MSGTAAAGGSWLEPSWERVEPGQTVSLTAQVSRGQQGWIEDGPFSVYLSANEKGPMVDPLGELEISEGQDRAEVSIEFAVPNDVPPGEYQLVVCNEPCTTGFGDLIGGVIYVAMDPTPNAAAVAALGQPVEASIAGAVALTETAEVVSKANSPAYQALAPHRSRPTGLSGLWLAGSAAMAALALGVVILSLRQPDTR